MPLSATSMHVLNASKDGDSTTSLCSLFKWLTNLSEKQLLVMSSGITWSRFLLCWWWLDYWLATNLTEFDLDAWPLWVLPAPACLPAPQRQWGASADSPGCWAGVWRGSWALVLGHWCKASIGAGEPISARCEWRHAPCLALLQDLVPNSGQLYRQARLECFS